MGRGVRLLSFVIFRVNLYTVSHPPFPVGHHSTSRPLRTRRHDFFVDLGSAPFSKRSPRPLPPSHSLARAHTISRLLACVCTSGVLTARLWKIKTNTTHNTNTIPPTRRQTPAASTPAAPGVGAPPPCQTPRTWGGESGSGSGVGSRASSSSSQGRTRPAEPVRWTEEQSLRLKSLVEGGQMVNNTGGSDWNRISKEVRGGVGVEEGMGAKRDM